MVRSNINHRFSDDDLTTRIGIAFATRPRIAAREIQVSVQHGVVTLRGFVPSAYDRHLVIALTRHVAGVFGIDDDLLLNDTTEITPEEREALVGVSHLKERAVSARTRNEGRTRRRMLRAGLAMIGLVFATLAGCGSADSGHVPVHPTSGAIKFRGQPVAGALVTLHPKEGTGTGAPSPRATVGHDGKFDLSTYVGQDGAPEGEYVLTVQWYRPVCQGNEVLGGPNVLPAKYASARTSDVLIKIAAGENRLQPIQIR